MRIGDRSNIESRGEERPEAQLTASPAMRALRALGPQAPEPLWQVQVDRLIRTTSPDALPAAVAGAPESIAARLRASLVARGALPSDGIASPGETMRWETRTGAVLAQAGTVSAGGPSMETARLFAIGRRGDALWRPLDKALSAGADARALCAGLVELGVELGSLCEKLDGRADDFLGHVAPHLSGQQAAAVLSSLAAGPTTTPAAREALETLLSGMDGRQLAEAIRLCGSDNARLLRSLPKESPARRRLAEACGANGRSVTAPVEEFSGAARRLLRGLPTPDQLVTDGERSALAESLSALERVDTASRATLDEALVRMRDASADGSARERALGRIETAWQSQLEGSEAALEQADSVLGAARDRIGELAEARTALAQRRSELKGEGPAVVEAQTYIDGLERLLTRELSALQEQLGVVESRREAVAATHAELLAHLDGATAGLVDSERTLQASAALLRQRAALRDLVAAGNPDDPAFADAGRTLGDKRELETHWQALLEQAVSLKAARDALPATAAAMRAGPLLDAQLAALEAQLDAIAEELLQVHAGERLTTELGAMGAAVDAQRWCEALVGDLDRATPRQIDERSRSGRAHVAALERELAHLKADRDAAKTTLAAADSTPLERARAQSTLSGTLPAGKDTDPPLPLASQVAALEQALALVQRTTSLVRDRHAMQAAGINAQLRCLGLPTIREEGTTVADLQTGVDRLAAALGVECPRLPVGESSWGQVADPIAGFLQAAAEQIVREQHVYAALLQEDPATCVPMLANGVPDWTRLGEARVAAQARVMTAAGLAPPMDAESCREIGRLARGETLAEPKSPLLKARLAQQHARHEEGARKLQGLLAGGDRGAQETARFLLGLSPHERQATLAAFEKLFGEGSLNRALEKLDGEELGWVSFALDEAVPHADRAARWARIAAKPNATEELRSTIDTYRDNLSNLRDHGTSSIDPAMAETMQRAIDRAEAARTSGAPAEIAQAMADLERVYAMAQRGAGARRERVAELAATGASISRAVAVMSTAMAVSVFTLGQGTGVAAAAAWGTLSGTGMGLLGEAAAQWRYEHKDVAGFGRAARDSAALAFTASLGVGMNVAALRALAQPGLTGTLARIAGSRLLTAGTMGAVNTNATMIAGGAEIALRAVTGDTSGARERLRSVPEDTLRAAATGAVLGAVVTRFTGWRRELVDAGYGLAEQGVANRMAGRRFTHGMVVATLQTVGTGLAMGMHGQPRRRAEPGTPELAAAPAADGPREEARIALLDEKGGEIHDSRVPGDTHTSRRGEPVASRLPGRERTYVPGSGRGMARIALNNDGKEVVLRDDASLAPGAFELRRSPDGVWLHDGENLIIQSESGETFFSKALPLRLATVFADHRASTPAYAARYETTGIGRFLLDEARKPGPNQPALILRMRPSFDHNSVLYNPEVVGRHMVAEFDDGVLRRTLRRGNVVDANGQAVHGDSCLFVAAHGGNRRYAGAENVQVMAEHAALVIAEAQAKGRRIDHVVLVACKQGDRPWRFARTNAQAFQRELLRALARRGIGPTTVHAERRPGYLVGGRSILEHAGGDLSATSEARFVPVQEPGKAPILLAVIAIGAGVGAGVAAVTGKADAAPNNEAEPKDVPPDRAK